MTARAGSTALGSPQAGGARLRQLLDATVATNHLVVAAPDRVTLLDGACRTLVASGAVATASIDADEDGDGWMEHLSIAGDAPPSVRSIRITTADVPEGRDPTGTAARTGRPSVCRDLAAGARTRPWREAYLRAGFRSSAAFPLRSKVLPSGVLTVHAAVRGALGPSEAQVLEQCAGTIGLAIDALAGRAEREAAKRAQRVNETLRQRMLEGVDAIIAYQEAEDDIPILSPQTERILGYKPEEIAPFPVWMEITHPDDLPACEQAWAAPEGSWDLTYRMRRADGAWIWVHDRGLRIRHDDGRGPGMFGIVVDDTERHRTVEALHRSEERFEELFGGMDAFLHYQCPAEGVAMLSPVGERMLGYPVGQLADPAFWRSLVHPDDIPACREHWDDPGDGWSMEYRMQRFDGAWIWVRDTVRRIVPEGGAPRLFGMVSDITASRVAAQALRESEERLQRTIDGVDAIIGHPGLEQETSVLSPQTWRILGYGPEELGAYAAWVAITHPDDLPACRAGWDSPDGRWDLTYRMRRRDGAWIWVNDRGVGAREEGGRLRKFSVITDVTERQHALEALRSSEERYRLLIESAVDGILVSDAAGQYTEANPAICRMLGYTREEILARSSPSLRAADDPVTPEQMDDLLESARQDTGFLVERRYRRKDGTSLVAEASFIKLPDGGLLREIRDIGPRREAEIEHERLAAAVQQTAESVVMTTPAGTITYVNPAFEQTTGYTAAEAIGRNPSLLQSGVQGPDFYRAMWDALTSARTWAGEFVNRRKDGTLFVEEATISPISAADGSLVGYVAVKRDVTAARELEAAHDLEASLRDRLARTIAAEPEDATTADVTRQLVDELGLVPGIAYAAVVSFVNSSEAMVLASHAPEGFPAVLDQHTRLTRAVRDTARRGPWAMAWSPTPDDGALGRTLTAAGIAGIAFAPIVHGDHADGVVVLATAEPKLAKTLVAHIGDLGDFTNTASALLAQRLHEERALAEARVALQQVIGARAFRPVFQSIVDLETRQVVGYEALTRFDGGERPDLVFARAWTVGLGPDLELATLAAVLESSQQLPAGRWLDVNVSPRLLLESAGPLCGVLDAADRPLVLEVTEREPVADYEALRAAVSRLGPDIRLAVDDAGAGIANFNHILELGADFVKLDISLVRGINAALGRQALVVGMRHFSRSTGCRLVAEGVETEQEAATLVQLGVEYGQGYLFGRPEAWDVVVPSGVRRLAASRRRTPADPSAVRAVRPLGTAVDRPRHGLDAGGGNPSRDPGLRGQALESRRAPQVGRPGPPRGAD